MIFCATSGICTSDVNLQLQVLAIGFSFSILWAVRVGFGLHDQYIPPDNELPLRQSEYAFSVLYVCYLHFVIGIAD